MHFISKWVDLIVYNAFMLNFTTCYCLLKTPYESLKYIHSMKTIYIKPWYSLYAKSPDIHNKYTQLISSKATKFSKPLHGILLKPLIRQKSINYGKLLKRILTITILSNWKKKKHHHTAQALKVKVLVAQSCPTLYDPMDCSPPSSSVHGIFQARILEWVAVPFSRGKENLFYLKLF